MSSAEADGDYKVQAEEKCELSHKKLGMQLRKRNPKIIEAKEIEVIEEVRKQPTPVKIQNEEVKYYDTAYCVHKRT